MQLKAFQKILSISLTVFLFIPIVHAEHQDYSEQLPNLNPTLQSTCDDIFTAACGTHDGAGITSNDRMSEVSKVLAENVKEAKQSLLKSMKLPSFFEGLKKVLAAEGIVVTADVPIDAQNYLLQAFGEGTKGYVNLQDTVFFKDVQTCQQQSDEFSKSLQEISYSYFSYPRNHALEIEKLDAIQAKVIQAENWLNDLSTNRKKSLEDNFHVVLKLATQKCESFKKLPPVQKAEKSNKDLNFICSHLSEIRDLAIEKIRNPANDRIKERIIQFATRAVGVIPINPYYFAGSTAAATPTISDKFDYTQAAASLIGPQAKAEQKAGTTTAVDRQLTYWKTRAAMASAEISKQNPCYELGEATYRTNKIKTITEKYLMSLLTSQVFLEELISKYYSVDIKPKTQKTFDEIKEMVLQQALLLVKDADLKENLRNQFARLEMAWLHKPKASDYVKHSVLGIPVLSEEAQLTLQFTNSMAGAALGDPSLGFFLSVNAFYVPSVHVGRFQRAAMVNMMPFFSYLRDREPLAFLAVLAHEIGHQIGPSLSIINGFSMKPFYQPILQCYAQTDSIHMQDFQSDETISDTIAAEVIAKIIANYPQEKKIRAALSSVSPFCYFEHMRSKSGSISLDDPHPISKLRVSGIFGGNSSLRKVLGCSKDAANFRTCEWR